MGYIDSATTITLRLTLTDEGRNKMLNTGTQVMDLFDKFGISYGDIGIHKYTQILQILVMILHNWDTYQM